MFGTPECPPRTCNERSRHYPNEYWFESCVSTLFETPLFPPQPKRLCHRSAICLRVGVILAPSKQAHRLCQPKISFPYLLFSCLFAGRILIILVASPRSVDTTTTRLPSRIPIVIDLGSS